MIQFFKNDPNIEFQKKSKYWESNIILRPIII